MSVTTSGLIIMDDTVVPFKSLELIPRRAASASKFRTLAFDAAVAALCIGLAILARLGIEQVVGGVAPFVLTFPAVLVATLVAGGRAGAIAAAGCQLLAIRFVFPNWISSHGGITTDLANVVLSTLALGATVWTATSYRRTSTLLRSQCEQRVGTLSLLITEMDHRTKNNFQIAANLLAHQSMTSFDPEVARELDKAAERLAAIASVYQNLTVSTSLGKNIDLADHLGRIVDMLRAGATPDRVLVSYRAEHVSVALDRSLIIGLIVNEWVSNALKHAFADRAGYIAISIVRRDGLIELIVQDDGSDHGLPRVGGRGSDLITSLAEVIGGKVTVASRANHGTRCSLLCSIV